MPCLFSTLIGSLAMLQSTLLTLAYVGKSERKANQLLEQIWQKLKILPEIIVIDCTRPEVDFCGSRRILSS